MPASIVHAQQAERVTIIVGEARQRLANTAHIGRGTTDEVDWARAGDTMIDHTAVGVRSARGTALARVETLVACAHQMFGTLVVGATSTLALVHVAYLVVSALAVHTTLRDTVARGTLLADGTVLVGQALQFASSLNANMILAAVEGRQAHSVDT